MRKVAPLVVADGVPSLSPSVTGGSGILVMSQGKDFPETHMGG